MSGFMRWTETLTACGGYLGPARAVPSGVEVDEGGDDVSDDNKMRMVGHERASTSLAGRTYVVTGVMTNPSAQACARRLYIAGARVVCACGDVQDAEKVLQTIRDAAANGLNADGDAIAPEGTAKESSQCGELIPLACDLSKLSTIDVFVKNFQSKAWALDGILCAENATHVEFATTEEGIERHFAINHLGHFKLTSLLLKELIRSAAANGREGRVVNLTSNLHHFTYRVRQGTIKPSRGIDFGNLNSAYGYNPLGSYGQSKLANILHAWEMQERMSDAKAPVRCVAATVGMTRDELELSLSFPGGSILASMASPVVTTAIEDGVATPLYCLTALELPQGVFFVDCKAAKSSLPSRDPRLAAELWDVSEEMCAGDDATVKLTSP